MSELKQSRMVTIHVKQQSNLAYVRMGANATPDMISKLSRIGSFMTKHGEVGRGLTFAEEVQLLPKIIAIAANSTVFEEKAIEYWKNISIEIPPPDVDGNFGGKDLEVGFEYRDEEGLNAGLAEEERENEKALAAWEDNKVYEMKFDVRLKYGRPINLADFIAYRYVLRHPKVANRREDVLKSSNIRYFIDTKELSAKARANKLKTIMKARETLVKVIGDRGMVSDYFAVMYRELDEIRHKDKEQYVTSDELMQDVILDRLAAEYPDTFTKLYNDKDLLTKAFIERAISAGHLRRIPNTQTITYADNITIGFTLADAVQWLTNPINAAIVQEIEAKMKHLVPIRLDKEPTAKKEVKPEGNETAPNVETGAGKTKEEKTGEQKTGGQKTTEI